MADVVNYNDFEQLFLDVEAMKKVVNGLDSEDVTTRLGKIYPTFAKALKIIQQVGGAKAYKTFADAQADVKNLSTNTPIFVLADSKDKNGLYLYDGTDLLPSEYDPLTQANLNTNSIVSALAFSTQNLSTTVESRTAENNIAFTNKFATLVFPAKIKNQTFNTFQIPIAWTSNFNKLRLRVVNLDGLAHTNSINTEEYLKDKKVYADITLTEAQVLKGASRIKYQNINSSINTQAVFRFDPITIYREEQNIGFVVQAINNDGTNAIIGCSTSTASTSSQNYFLYAEDGNGGNVNTLSRAEVGASFLLKFEKEIYKQSVRDLVKYRSSVIDSLTVSKTDFGAGYFAIAKNFYFLKDQAFNSISLFLSNLPNIKHLRYTIFSCDPSTTSDGWMGTGRSTAVYSDIIQTKNTTDASKYYEVEFPFDSSLIKSDHSVGITVQPINSDDSTGLIGFRCGNPHKSNLSGSECGYYAGIVSDSQIGLNYLGGDLEIAFVAKKYNFVNQVAELDSTTPVTTESPSYFGVSTKIENIVVDGLNVSYDFIYKNMKYQISDRRTATFDATGTITKTDTVTLLKSGSLSYSNNNTFLARYLRDIVVKQGSTVLVNGTDYLVYDWYGKLNSARDNLNNVQVDVTYTYEPFRVDTLVFDVSTRTTYVVKGADRTRDPYEYAATLNSSQKPLAYALVHASTVEFIALGDVQELASLPIDPVNDWDSIQQHNEKSLSAVKLRLNRGENIKHIALGDSITACGTGTAPLDSPNGLYRDRIEFFSETYPADTVATIEKFSRDGTDNHAKFGWNWSLKAYIDNLYGVTLDYQNWGVGGIGLPQVISQMPNVLPTISKGDLVVLCIGTNGGVGIDGLDSVLKPIKQIGASVLIMPIPLSTTQNAHEMSNQETWSKWNAMLVQTAFKNGCAIVPTWHYLLDNSPMNIGMSDKFRSNQNLINHPGMFEYKCYSKMLVNAFSG